MVAEPKCECGRLAGLFFREERWWCYDCAFAEIEQLREVLEELVDAQNGPPLCRNEREWYRTMTRAARLLGRANAVRDYSRCRESEGGDGDTWAGCVLDDGHEGECQRRARPEWVRDKAAEAVGNE